MAINIKFDLAGNPEPPTIILATRSGQKLGQLEVDPESIDLSDKFNDASEISFTLNKYINGKLTNLWDKVVNFKLIYCKEWDMWFEATVELDEETETIKTVFCKQLGQAELSQIMLYNIEINTEDDIARDDYKITILYDENDFESSLLHRLLRDKAPHYSIVHVDNTIAKIQRMFSFDDISIYDAFQEISEEIGCLFVYHSDSDENGSIRRGISVYDLQQNCSDCGYRGEYTDVCPKCGSTNIDNGYGEDTLIFVTADELASDGIQLTTDTDSVKNCFKLEAGDDLMTATIRNCNPNGTDYIWYLSDAVKEDMSKELTEKIKSYDENYEIYQNSYVATLDSELINKYNALVDKYKIYNDKLEYIESPIVGYSSLMNAYYNTIDLSLYLQSVLMPTIEMSDTNASEEAKKLTANNISPVSVNSIADISVSTANNAVLAMAKIIVDSRYRVKVNSSSLERGEHNQIWNGNFTVTNYSDDEDNATSDMITVVVDDNYSEFIKQKIQKTLNKEDTEDLSISGLFEKSYNEFVLELKKYSLNCLNSFYNSCQACIDILIEQGIADKDTWSGQEPNLYEDLYSPYLQKMSAIEAELKVRQEEIDSIIGIYDENNELKTYGIQNYVQDIKNNIQKDLDFQNYLGYDLWLEFCAFRREDKYSNSNYISDGLDNAQLFKNALEFIDVAKNEIFKSAELQHSITTSLKNLLAIDKFKPLVKYFKLGNWIRVQIDNKIYKLRLLDYEISYSDFDNVPVSFSDVMKIKNGISDVQNVISQASSMATSYDFVQRQASQGAKSNSVLNSWFNNGLDATNTKIVGGADNQTQTWDEHGMLFRQYNSTTDTYDDTQLKIINSTIAITDDNWETTKTAIGNFYYNDPVTKEIKNAYGINGEVIIGKLMIGEGLGIYNDSGSLTFDDNGFVVSNGANIVSINPNDTSVFNIKNQDGNVFSFDEEGNLVIIGDITAKNLTLLDDAEFTVGRINGLSDVAISGDYNDLINTPNLKSVATSGNYNDLINTPKNVSHFNNDAGYLADKDLSEAIDDALSKAKESGEFNGKDGVSATHSWKDTTLTITSASGTSSADLKGEKGDTPVRGTDYWTNEDKVEIVNAVLEELRNQGIIS